MGRRNRGGMSEWDMERQMDDIDRRRGSGGDDSDLLAIAVGVVVAGAAALAGAGWLDAQFGWGLRAWLEGLISGG